MREKINKLNELIENIRPNTPMTEENTKIMLSIMMDKTGKSEEIITEDNPEIKDIGGMRIFIDRLNKMANLKITMGAAIFIGLHIDNPGNAVIYAYYIHRKFNGGTTVTFKDLTSLEFFGWGMLSDQQMNDIWDAQKINSKKEEEKARKELGLVGVHDNLLDYIKTWEK